MTRGEHRESPRELIAQLFVGMGPDDSVDDPIWVASAVDINLNGMSMVLPPELRPGDRIRLNLQLDDQYILTRVPALVVRPEVAGVGAVKFVEWSDGDRLALASSLLRRGCSRVA